MYFQVSRYMVMAAIVGLVCSDLMIPTSARSQLRSGAAFLKILPGTRQQGLATSLTAGIDEMHTLYANPAATGYLREWQWAINYTEWFADIYNISINYGRRVRTPWSREARFALGLYYQGVRDFESTEGTEPAVSASDMLLTFSYGNPLTFLSRNVSVGGNIKYLRSKLADFTASSVVFDGGLLYRSNRFKLKTGMFDYAIVSAGVAATQMGKSLGYISERTPLPTTLRAGLALNIGKHNGLQFQLSGDYQKVKDETGRISFGAEVSWAYALAFRTGYNFTNNILSKFAMGLSLRLDDLNSPVKNVLPGRNNGMRVDIATLENNDFFAASYRAGVNHYPIAPENFDISSELLGTCVGNGNVNLSWEMAQDPDLYDDVRYSLFLMREDSSKLADVIDRVETGEFDFANHADPTLDIISAPEQFAVDKKRRQMSYTFFAVSEGNYYWTVMASDRDNHVHFARKIEHFNLPEPSQPDLLITRIDFHLNQNEIIADGYNGDCQGEIHLTITNQSKCSADNFTVNVYDSLNVDPRLYTMRNPDELPPPDNQKRSIYQTQIAELLPGEQQIIPVPWHRARDGADYIVAYIDEENVIHEQDELNNRKTQQIALPEMDIKIAASPNDVAVGDTVMYTLRIENRGSSTAENFHLHNQIPTFLTLVDSSSSLTPDSLSAEHVSWWFPALLPGDVREITYFATVDSAVSNITNVGRILSPCDMLPTNNVDSTKVSGVRYDLRLGLAANVDPLRPKVKFNLNDSTLTTSSLQQLDILGRALQSGLLESTFIKIEGHTDLQGFRNHSISQNRKRNQKLSEGRARCVENYLVSNYNIAPDRICGFGFGQERPISRLHEDNRRTEINILRNPISCSAAATADVTIPAVYQQANITYTITISNQGPDPAQNIKLTDILPANVSLLTDSFNQEPERGLATQDTLTWYIPWISAGDTKEITFKVTVDSIPSNSHAYELRNAAHVTSRFDNNKNNNSATAAVYAIAGTAPKSTKSNNLRIHIVEPGETLSLISQKYYQDPAHWGTIFVANQLAQPHMIYPGQELLIPDAPFAANIEDVNAHAPRSNHSQQGNRDTVESAPPTPPSLPPQNEPPNRRRVRGNTRLHASDFRTDKS